MFYLIDAGGYPHQYATFEEYFEEHRNHVQGCNEANPNRASAMPPRRTEFHSNDCAEGLFGMPMKIWFRNGRFIGWEF